MPCHHTELQKLLNSKKNFPITLNCSQQFGNVPKTIKKIHCSVEYIVSSWIEHKLSNIFHDIPFKEYLILH